jgi:hypothetical protein
MHPTLRDALLAGATPLIANILLALLAGYLTSRCITSFAPSFIKAGLSGFDMSKRTRTHEQT